MKKIFRYIISRSNMLIKSKLSTAVNRNSYPIFAVLVTAWFYSTPKICNKFPFSADYNMYLFLCLKHSFYLLAIFFLSVLWHELKNIKATQYTTSFSLNMLSTQFHNTFIKMINRQTCSFSF